MRELKLELPTVDYEKLQEKADGRKKQGVMVSWKALGLLLTDHGRALAELEKLGVKVE